MRGNSSGNGWTPPRHLPDAVGGLILRHNRFNMP